MVGTLASVETEGPIITMSRVSKRYGDVEALRDVSFGINRGELAFLVGPSGSGKSTILKLLTRELLPDDGSVYVAGRDISRMRIGKIPQLRRVAAYGPQDNPLLPGRSIEENILFALSVLGWPRERAGRRVEEILELVGLTDRRKARSEELSGGERQRAVIARAVASAPKILLADEPTGNLDPDTTVGVMRILDAISRAGTTVLVSTHDRNVVDAMKKRVIALENGRVSRIEEYGSYRGGSDA
jgi:cell division transport system ATP-binding protein